VRILVALIASLTLPAGGVQWWNVAPAGKSVLVTGAPTGGLCEFFVVDTSTLKGRGPYKRSCNKAPVSLHAITPVVGSSRDAFHVPVTVAGKVVMHFEDASDTRPQYAWYGRSLWIYDVATSDGSEVLRFDARTGKLLQRTAMPEMDRPVMVANGDGLWLDPAPNGGMSGSNGNIVPVLHVVFGASKPIVAHRGGRAAMWMAASAHTVWFEQISGLSSVGIWRVDGTKVRLLARPKKVGFQAVYGGGKLWVLTCGVKEHLLRIDPTDGTQTAVGQFPRIANYCDASMAVAGGDVFVLEDQKLYAYK
jgi:outer membrane protein assembly factor BamB